jgi:hypothetical protein
MTVLRRRLYLVAVASVALAALAALCYFAYTAGINTALQGSHYCHILHAERELSALDNLREQDAEATRSNLETGLNLSVVFLSNAYSSMDERALQSSHETLLKIKKHREQYPWAGYDENLRQRIQTVLDAVHEEPKTRP